jgi:predicted HTH domain antitoxin
MNDGLNWGVTLTLPDHIQALNEMSQRELQQELALSLCGGRKLTLVQAVDLAGAGFFEFQELLRRRQIPQHYDESDLDRDLLTLRELPPS